MNIDKVNLPRPSVYYRPTYRPFISNAAQGFVDNSLAVDRNNRAAAEQKMLQDQNARAQARFDAQQKANQEKASRAQALDQMQKDYYVFGAMLKDFNDTSFDKGQLPQYIHDVAMATGRPPEWAAKEIAQVVNPDGTVDPAKANVYVQRTLDRLKRVYPLYQKQFEKKPSTKDVAAANLDTEKALTEKDKRLHPEKYRTPTKPAKKTLADRWLENNPDKGVEDWLRVKADIKNKAKKGSNGNIAKEKRDYRLELTKIGLGYGLTGSDLKDFVTQGMDEAFPSKLPPLSFEDIVAIAKTNNYGETDLDAFAKVLKEKRHVSDAVIKAAMKQIRKNIKANPARQKLDKMMKNKGANLPYAKGDVKSLINAANRGKPLAPTPIPPGFETTAPIPQNPLATGATNLDWYKILGGKSGRIGPRPF